jgi:hypothetical protein
MTVCVEVRERSFRGYKLSDERSLGLLLTHLLTRLDHLDHIRFLTVLQSLESKFKVRHVLYLIYGPYSMRPASRPFYSL